MTAWAVTDLPGAGFAHHAHDLAGAHGERDVLDRVRPVRAGGRPTVRPSMARTGEAVFGHLPHTRLAKRGSSVSRRPSPSMLMASTANARNTPG